MKLSDAQHRALQLASEGRVTYAMPSGRDRGSPIGVRANHREMEMRRGAPTQATMHALKEAGLVEYPPTRMADWSARPFTITEAGAALIAELGQPEPGAPLTSRETECLAALREDGHWTVDPLRRVRFSEYGRRGFGKATVESLVAKGVAEREYKNGRTYGRYAIYPKGAEFEWPEEDVVVSLKPSQWTQVLDAVDEGLTDADVIQAIRAAAEDDV